MNLDAAMHQAVALHQAGRLEAAAAAYDAILARWPDFGEALNLGGVALSQLGRHDEALARLGRAVGLQPGHPLWRHNLGKALHDAGRLDQAEREYRAALALQPGLGEAMFNLANLLKESERLDEAAALYRRLLEQHPNHPRALNNLGNTLGKLKRFDDAETALRALLAQRPDHADAYNNLGIVLADRGRGAEALAAYARALELKPDFAQAHLNRGNALLDQDRADDAVTAFETALAVDPGLDEAYINLGNARLAQGRTDASLAAYDRALALRPGDINAHFNRALAWLLIGDFERGWAEYEWGLRGRLREPRRDFPQPRWDGTRFDGRTLLVVGEQGIGDVFQFLRYLPLAAALGGDVVAEVQQGLASLCARAYPDIRFIERENDGRIGPAFDLHCHLMSLPYLLGHRTEADIPAATAYLRADPARVGAWAERLAGSPGYRIGLVWAGNPEHKNDRRRSIPLAQLRPLAGIAGARLFSLQKGPGAAQLGGPDTPGIVDLGADITSFEDTAAIIANLDLVVSVDTSVGHLAAALGRSTRVLLPHLPDWRWQLGRADTPWYPRLRLLRQPAPGAWPDVVAELVRELADLAAR